MDLNRMTGIIKANPNFHKAGMIATHLGIVRSLLSQGLMWNLTMTSSRK